MCGHHIFRFIIEHIIWQWNLKSNWKSRFTKLTSLKKTVAFYSPFVYYKFSTSVTLGQFRQRNMSGGHWKHEMGRLRSAELIIVYRNQSGIFSDWTVISVLVNQIMYLNLPYSWHSRLYLKSVILCCPD